MAPGRHRAAKEARPRAGDAQLTLGPAFRRTLWTPALRGRRWPPASVWRGGRRFPVVPPRRAATPAAPESSSSFRPCRVRPAFIGGTVGPLLPPTPPFRRRLRWFGS